MKLYSIILTIIVLLILSTFVLAENIIILPIEPETPECLSRTSSGSRGGGN